VFNLPTRRAITLEQNAQEQDDWFSHCFKIVKHISNVFLVGSPPLQYVRSDVPRFSRIWKMLSNAQTSTTKVFGTRRRGYIPSTSARFVFIPPPDKPILVRLEESDGDKTTDYQEFILPALLLSWVERNGRGSVVVYGRESVKSKGLHYPLIMVIDDQGLAYSTTYLGEL
jgi:hypothetical protein